MDPRHPTTLKNLAETYNLMNDSVRSKAYWQRLVDLGPGVGTVYAVAKDHVLLLDSGHDADPLKEPSTLSRLVYTSILSRKHPWKRGTATRSFTCARSSCAKPRRWPTSTRKNSSPM